MVRELYFLQDSLGPDCLRRTLDTAANWFVTKLVEVSKGTAREKTLPRPHSTTCRQLLSGFPPANHRPNGMHITYNIYYIHVVFFKRLHTTLSDPLAQLRAVPQEPAPASFCLRSGCIQVLHPPPHLLVRLFFLFSFLFFFYKYSPPPTRTLH